MKQRHRPFRQCCLLLLLALIVCSILMQWAYAELLHVPDYGDLKYRRVCTEVYQATLCMTIRYPFEVPLQDETLDFPYPVDNRFYDLTDPPFFINGQLLDEYRSNEELAQVPIAARIIRCLDHEAAKRPNQVIVVFSRRDPRRAESEDLYGTKSVIQQQRLFDFFRNHDVVVIGDSLGPMVRDAVSELFGTCQLTHERMLGDNKWYQYKMHACPEPAHLSTITEDTGETAVQRQLRKRSPSISQAPNSILLGNMWYHPVLYPHSKYHTHWHVANGTLTLLEEFRSKAFLLRRGLAGQPTNQLRPLSIIMEHPIAHVQTQEMIVESLAQVLYNQQSLAETVMNISTSPTAKIELAKMGFELSHMMVFDGFPQHFPSATSAYVQFPHNTQEEFLRGGGYPGWQPALGSACRGPVPYKSILAGINRQGRMQYMNHGIDMTRWYGRTWEFANQFWWGMVMWDKTGRGGLDCTHYGVKGKAALTVVSYFIQAMIDGYYTETH